MKENSSKKPKEIRLDDIDRQIMSILWKNSRTKLTSISKDVGLSVDSVKKRIKKLEDSKVIMRYSLNIDTDKLGLPLGIHVHIKLKDVVKERYQEFVNELARNHRVIVLIDMLGDYDIFTVFLAKDTEEMDEMKLELRQRFSDIIGEWTESITSRIRILEEFRF